jgi:predicted NBD/HSP70 family sugar kinase
VNRGRSQPYRASVAAVLRYAWDVGAFRADHAMAALGHTRSTTLSALDSLVGLGLIRELEGDSSRTNQLGRPARLFELRGEAGVIVGVDAGARRLTAVAADLTGRVLASEHLVHPAPLDVETWDAQWRRHAVLRLVDEVLSSADRTRDKVIAVGVGIPAPVNDRGNSPSHDAGFWPAMNADLHQVLAEVFPVVRVENDAALAALAEGSYGEAVGRENYVAVLSGRRLGSGVVLGGRLVRGTNGGVGELEALTAVTGVGSTKGIGFVIEERVKQLLADGHVPPGHPWAGMATAGVTAETVLAKPGLDNALSRARIKEVGDRIGRVCSVIAHFYDPEVIVLCGAVVESAGEILQVARAHVAADVELPPPDIVPSGLGGDVVSIGAVAAARESARDTVLALFATAQAGEH